MKNKISTYALIRENRPKLPLIELVEPCGKVGDEMTGKTKRKKAREISPNIRMSSEQVHSWLSLHEAPEGLKKFIKDGKVSVTLALELYMKEPISRRDWTKVKETLDDAYSIFRFSPGRKGKSKITRKDLLELKYIKD